jgi:N-acetyl sugar amidotransferase
MDTIADPDIRFNEQGVCNYYYSFLEKLKIRVPAPGEREQQLERLVAKMKKDGRGNQYDCVIGVSGGIDSTYVAYKVKELGLRPLAVHVDNGWNSELAVENIEKTLNTLHIDLFTEVLDWPVFSDLQLSFLKASTPDAEIPTDHIIWSTLYKTANKFGIKYILSGMNFRTEGLLPPTWARGYFDWKYISSVQKQFGSKDISKLPHLTYRDLAYYTAVKRIKIIGILNYLDFSKQEALTILQSKLGYRPYDGKHHESVYTKFFQSYILPKKFGIDKRKAHLSCMIMGSKEITRDEALEILQAPIAPEKQLEEELIYVCKKLRISADEMKRIMQLPIKTIYDYPNNHARELKLRKLLNKLRGKRLVEN